jgi:hypothetical protein
MFIDASQKIIPSPFWAKASHYAPIGALGHDPGTSFYKHFATTWLLASSPSCRRMLMSPPSSVRNESKNPVVSPAHQLVQSAAHVFGPTMPSPVKPSFS